MLGVCDKPVVRVVTSVSTFSAKSTQSRGGVTGGVLVLCCLLLTSGAVPN